LNALVAARSGGLPEEELQVLTQALSFHDFLNHGLIIIQHVP
jgi:hypothetical protein